MENLMLPTLVVPFLAQAAMTTGGGFELCWPGVRIRVGEGSLLPVCDAADALLAEQVAEVVVTGCEAPEAAPDVESPAVSQAPAADAEESQPADVVAADGPTPDPAGAVVVPPSGDDHPDAGQEDRRDEADHRT